MLDVTGGLGEEVVHSRFEVLQGSERDHVALQIRARLSFLDG